MMPQAALPVRMPEPPAAEVIGPVRLRLHAPLRSLPPADDAENGGKPNIFGYLKYRWITVLFLGGMLGTGLAYAAWNLVPSKYTTTAMIRVSADQPTLYLSENP